MVNRVENGESGSAVQQWQSSAKPHDWRQTMSDNVATALLVYTSLHIFSTIKALAEIMDGSLLPYLMLLVFVGLFVPVCRYYEKRWAGLSDAAAGDMALRPAFRRDAAVLWLAAIAIPLTLTLIFKALAGD